MRDFVLPTSVMRRASPRVRRDATQDVDGRIDRRRDDDDVGVAQRRRAIASSALVTTSVAHRGGEMRRVGVVRAHAHAARREIARDRTADQPEPDDRDAIVRRHPTLIATPPAARRDMPTICQKTSRTGSGGRPASRADVGDAPNHRRLARRIEDRQAGEALELARALAERQAPREERDDLAIDALDLVAAARELRRAPRPARRRRSCDRPRVDAAHRASVRPAAAANAPSRSIMCANAGGASD